MSTAETRIFSDPASLRSSSKSDTARKEGHSVQFYQNDSFLIEGLSRFIGSAILAGDAALVIATKAHREALEERLTHSGLNLAVPGGQGRLLFLDANDTLAKITVDGHPDGALFEQVIGGAIAQLATSMTGESRRVAVFGEMVALLWSAGKPEAALHLEQLWSQLAARYAFQLHCAYPLELFSKTSDGIGFEKVCTIHSHVSPAERYTELHTEEERLHAIALLQQKARALETEVREREQAELALRKNEERFRLAQQAAGIGAFEWDLRTQVNRWTPELEAIYGLPSGGFPGTYENFLNLVHPDDRASLIQQVEQSLQTGAPMQAEWRVVWPDGSIHWVLGKWQALLEAGTPVSVSGINIDVTDRKEAGMAQYRLAAIVQSSDDAIASKDLNGIVTSWNESAERLFGYKAGEIIGKPITTIIPPELQDDEPVILAKIRAGERIAHFQTVRLRKDGQRIDVSLTISPVRDEKGKIVGAAKIIRDITETKKIELALRTTEKLAAAGRLAATVAHEINNPLEAVTNLVYLASRDLPDSMKVSRHLELASRELDRVAHIARQTLGFYRDTSRPACFSLTETIDDVLGLYEKRFETRRITVVRQYETRMQITALQGEIRQAFSNLITNAIDAMTAGGSLIIRVSRSHEWSNSLQRGIRITIVDNGSGISQQYRKNLFQPFFTTKKDVGTGLGLWITRSIVEKTGGNIRLKTSTGPVRHGTAFSIFLPLDENSAPEDNLSRDDLR